MPLSLPIWFQQVVPLRNPEDMREAMRGANVETVPLAPKF
jgi:hypothetical protein